MNKNIIACGVILGSLKLGLSYEQLNQLLDIGSDEVDYDPDELQELFKIESTTKRQIQATKLLFGEDFGKYIDRGLELGLTEEQVLLFCTIHCDHRDAKAILDCLEIGIPYDIVSDFVRISVSLYDDEFRYNCNVINILKRMYLNGILSGKEKYLKQFRWDEFLYIMKCIYDGIPENYLDIIIDPSLTYPMLHEFRFGLLNGMTIEQCIKFKEYCNSGDYDCDSEDNKLYEIMGLDDDADYNYDGFDTLYWNNNGFFKKYFGI